MSHWHDECPIHGTAVHCDGIVWLVKSHTIAARDPKTGHNAEVTTRTEKQIPCEHESYCELAKARAA